MKSPQPKDPRRVFIAGLRSFDIVYLPETGQISSRISKGGNTVSELGRVASPPVENDEDRPER
jgi:hypothetical protein